MVEKKRNQTLTRNGKNDRYVLLKWDGKRITNGKPNLQVFVREE
jgi:hypothetical protein